MNALLPQFEPPPEPAQDLRPARLIRHLRSLARRTDKDSQARAAMAELRRGLRDDPRDRLVVGKHVVPFLGETTQPDEEWFYLVAAMFASHPLSAPKVSLGAAFRQIKDDSGSTEKRFLNLLSARPEQMRILLRQAVSLLAVSRRPIGLDWELLLKHLLRWSLPNKPVQQRWARDFYSTIPLTDEQDDPQTTSPQNGDPDED